MENQFKVGDAVKLKSGGPIMIITTYTNDPSKTKVVCAWHDKDNKPLEAVYPISGLVPHN